MAKITAITSLKEMKPQQHAKKPGKSLKPVSQKNARRMLRVCGNILRVGGRTQGYQTLGRRITPLQELQRKLLKS